MKERGNAGGSIVYGVGILGLLSVGFGGVDINVIQPTQLQNLDQRQSALQTNLSGLRKTANDLEEKISLNLSVVEIKTMDEEAGRILEESGRLEKSTSEIRQSLDQVEKDVQRDKWVMGLGLIGMLSGVVQLLRDYKRSISLS